MHRSLKITAEIFMKSSESLPRGSPRLRPKAAAMKLRQPLTALSLALLLHGSPAFADDIRLGDAVAPVRQSVYLEVDPQAEGYQGSTEIVLNLKAEAKEIVLHALDLKVTEAALVAGGKTFPLSATPLENGKLKLSCEQTLPKGEAVLKLSFQAAFNRRSVGLYKYLDGDKPYLSTQFEMTDARRCFPCFDQPNFKIPYQMTVKAPRAARVYNNSAETKTAEENGQTVHTFAQTPPLPSYLVALAVGPYEETDVPKLSVPGRLVTTEGKLGQSGAAIAATPKILDALQEYFGIPYAYGKLDQIAVTEFPFGAMENAGMVTYREDILLVNEATAQRRNRERMYSVIAHELAHQWFGNLVTMGWWDDLWLNEAFATWMANKVLVELYPELERDLVTYQNMAMGEDGKTTARAIRKPIRNDSDIMDGLGLNYTKGAAVLTMIERWIGAEAFRQGIRNYMQAHKFGNAAAADLWTSLGDASEKDVAGVLKSYTEQPGYPLVDVAVSGRRVSLTQRRFAYADTTPAEQSWTFPVGVRYGSGDRVEVARTVLDHGSASVELAFEPEWLFPDDGGVGYYRWSVGETQREALLRRHLNKMSTREKIAFQANLSGLYDAGRLSAGELLAANAAFLKDSHPSVVEPALHTLAALREVMVDGENLADWKGYLAGVTKPLLSRLGRSSKKGEPAKEAELRTQLLGLLARDSDDPAFLKLATEQTERFLSDSGSVDQALIDVYLYLSAKSGDQALVERVKTQLAAAKDPQRRGSLLAMLGRFERPQAQLLALDAMLEPVVTPSDLRSLLALNGDGEARRARLQGWVEKNYTALSGKLPSAFVAVIVSAQSGVSDLAEFEKLRAFYSAQPDPNGALKRELEKVSETVRLTVAERERGRASFTRAIIPD